MELSDDELKKLKYGISIMNGYKAVVDVLMNKQNTDSLSRVSQMEIAKELDVSQTNVSHRLKVLEKFNIIKKIQPGMYQVMDKDMKDSPFILMIKILRLYHEKPELINKYKLLSEELKVPEDKVRIALGFINNIIYKSV